MSIYLSQLIPLAFSFFALLVLFWLLRRLFFNLYKFPRAFQLVTLLITVPKESTEDQQQKRELKELIGPMEMFYANLGGMKAQKGFRAFLFGRYDHLSLEIVADHDGLISFYLSIPRYMQQFIEQQIQAQYPHSQIEEVTDYNIFSPQGVILGASLVLKKNYIFPIKTYLKMDSDPLNAVINTLSKLNPGVSPLASSRVSVSGLDGAAIQIIVRSARPSWHKRGAKVASEMQQGKKLSEALRMVQANKFLKFLGDILEDLEDIIENLWLIKPVKKDELDSAPAPKEPYRLSPMEEEVIKSLEEKTSRAGFDVNIRIIVSSSNRERAEANLKNILNSFAQYSGYEYANSFKAVRPRKLEKLIQNFIYRHFDEKRKIILNTEEMVSLYHFPLPQTETPNIRWLLAKKAPAPTNLPQQGIILGKNIYRGIEKMIRIKRDDRRRHVYIIGKSGVGKSFLMANMARQDIANGEGICVVDPHGDLVEDILVAVPKERAEDVIYFCPSDIERPIGLNVLEAKTPQEADFAVQEMIAIWQKMFPPEILGPMFEHNMRNNLLTLMADEKNPGTLIEIPRLFTDPDYQKEKLAKVKNPQVRLYWEKEMAKTTDFHKSEMYGYIISKVGRFAENEMMKNIIGQTHSGFDFRDVMDNKKILLVNLAKGKTGEVNSNLLGLIIVSKLQMAAMSRADLPSEQRGDFYLYIDEFQNFITDSIATILSEARKYRLNLTMAHQYLGQLVQGTDTRIKEAVLGNAGTMISFKIGVEDAETMAKEFAPVFNEYDLVNVEKFNAYVKLLIDNQASRAFNMQTFLLDPGNPEIASHIKELSRLKYGRERKEVEVEIMERAKLSESEAVTGPGAGERNL